MRYRFQNCIERREVPYREDVLWCFQRVCWLEVWRFDEITTHRRVEKDHVEDFRAALKRLADEGVIKAATTEVDSCALFVEFKRRYGNGRAKCLK